MGKLKRVIICIIVFAMLVTGLGPATLHPQAATKVKLNTTKVTLSVGDTKQLKVSGTKKKVTWSSSKKSVAIVSKKGKVTAKKAGTATITAKVGKKKLTCKVTVSKMKTLELNSKTSVGGFNYTEVDVGDKIQAYVNTDKKVKWSSDNKKVATVNKNGKITVKDSGFVTIRADYGSTWKQVQLKVRLYDQIQLNTTSITLYYEDRLCDEAEYMAKYEPYMDGNYKVKLTASYVSGRKCSNKDFFWSKDEEHISEAYYCNSTQEVIKLKSDGTIIPENVGTTKVWVEDRLSGTKACCEVTVKSKLEEDVNNRVEEIISEIITDNMTDAQKVLAVHDWICLNTHYGNSYAIGGVYSVLFGGSGHCWEYAEAFACFMRMLDIPCIVAGSSIMNHEWNQVELNGKWYWLDCTFDDADYQDKIRYKFFLNTGYRQTDEYRMDYLSPKEYGDTDKGIKYTEPAPTEKQIYEAINGKVVSKDDRYYKYTSKYNPHVDGIIMPE